MYIDHILQLPLLINYVFRLTIKNNKCKNNEKKGFGLPSLDLFNETYNLTVF